MIATYKNHTIEPVKREGVYHALIDGKESGITSKYRGSAIKRAIRACQEQERRQAITQLKELGL